MLSVEVVLIILLGITAILDLYFKAVPSILMTAILLTTAILFPQNLIFGIFALIYALLLYEGEFVGGVADIKFMSIIGLTIGSMETFFSFVILVVLLGFIYKTVLVYVGYEQKSEVPFLPCLFIVYILTLII